MTAYANLGMRRQPMPRPATFDEYLRIRPQMIDTTGQPLVLTSCESCKRQHFTVEPCAVEAPARAAARPPADAGGHPATTPRAGTPSAWPCSRNCATPARPPDCPRWPAGPSPRGRLLRRRCSSGVSYERAELRPARRAAPLALPRPRRDGARPSRSTATYGGRQQAPTAHPFCCREAFGSIRSAGLCTSAFAAYPPSLRSVRYSTVACAPSGSP